MRLRLERMSDSARQVATVAAAMGRRFSLDDVAAMLNLSPSELLRPVDELVHADLLAEGDGRPCSATTSSWKRCEPASRSLCFARLIDRRPGFS